MNMLLIKLYGLLLIIIGVLILAIICQYYFAQSKKLEQAAKQIDTNSLKEVLLEKIKIQINDLLHTPDLPVLHNSKHTLRENMLLHLTNYCRKTKADIELLFHPQLTNLKEEYPNLTDLDLLILTFLGIGMDNVEICSFLDMEKRTLYRRRQLISQRLNISSLQLDEFAIGFFKIQ